MVDEKDFEAVLRNIELDDAHRLIIGEVDAGDFVIKMAVTGSLHLDAAQFEEGKHIIERERPREKEALGFFAPYRLKEIKMLLGLNAFAEGLNSKGFGQSDHMLDDLFGVIAEISEEGHIELDFIEVIVL